MKRSSQVGTVTRSTGVVKSSSLHAICTTRGAWVRFRNAMARLLSTYTDKMAGKGRVLVISQPSHHYHRYLCLGLLFYEGKLDEKVNQDDTCWGANLNFKTLDEPLLR